MTVDVDDLRILATVGRYTTRWSHLFTDSDDLTELHDFAASIGLRPSWCQDNQSGPHYDVTDRLPQAATTADAHPFAWHDSRTLWSSRGTQHAGNRR